ncbi:MAG TPA: hypothetical protein VER33_03525 [Polyangiaceae bacterium]|nr:hypothetical protein [Polyangiaceae bacterium]
MSRSSRDSFDPRRLLETSESNLATQLLKSAATERPRPASLAKALSAASLAASATALSASSAAAGGLAKTVATWLVLGGLGGTVVSAGLLQLTDTEAPAAGVSRARPSAGKDAFPASRTAPTLPSPNPPSQETPTASASPVDLERPPPSTALRQRAVRPTPLGNAPLARTSIAAEAPAVAQPEAGLPKHEAAAPAPGAAKDQGPVAAAPATGTPSGAAASVGPARALGPAPSAASQAFAQELSIIDAARRSLASGDPSRALGNVARYARAFPAGQFRSEALALEIEARALGGDVLRARGLAQRFLQHYPGHPLAPRVRAVTGIAAASP